MNCLQCCSSEEILTNPKKGCLKISVKKTVNMPEKSSNIQSNSYCKHLQVSFVIHSDFECNLKEVQKCNRDNANALYTDKYQGHIVCS